MNVFITVFLLSSSPLVYGASIQISLSADFVSLNDFDNNPLNAGTSSNGDGAILQLGYYTASTTVGPFSGDWVAMTGPGTSYPTTIGDSGNQDPGSFKIVVLFSQGSYSFPEPPVGTPMALRFYNSTSLGTSTYFNAVTDTVAQFNWVAPSDPTSSAGLSLTFLTAGVVWQDGAGSAFRTTIPVPEPSSSALFALVSLGVMVVRRR